MTDLFQRLRLIWLVLIGLLAAATGSFAAVSGYDGENGCSLAAKSADQIALGIRAQGLEQTAQQVGARHLLNDANWMQSLQTAIKDPAAKFTISVDGFAVSSTYSQLMGAAQRGAAKGLKGYATDWEISQLYQAGRLGEATLMQGGKVIPNPLAP